ncbi:glycosyltransferase [Dokdonia sinensis]|uniref:Glycosyltransferase n=1 Tax=Dokdonia sinensis TaxID=2479847 RepID=A0A3M0FZ62_9FLAO|nr:glycosyltransferase [Dokdonia sinensis]RMB57954.1 glycosyltransferase [Dokdonia sinensis]
MKKLVIIQTATPDYRAGFFNALRTAMGNNFQLYRGSRYFETSVKSDTTISAVDIGNHYLLGRRALFQTGIWHLVFKNVVLVLEMNPRIISNWIFLLLRMIVGKKTILWGHAWPRGGRDSKSDDLRNIMRNLAPAIVVYTEKQAAELLLRMPCKDIQAAPNALLSADQMELVTPEKTPLNLIYVGRLTKAKKPLFLAKSFFQSMDVIPKEAKLIFVGSGDQIELIEKFIIDNGLQDRILLMGHIGDYTKLRNLYSSSIFSVSPGYVGLSLTQSLGFGVPMLISRDEPHSPEIEAATENENTLFYKSDDAISFRESVKSIYKSRELWISKRPDIAMHCKKKYSVEAMANVFINLTNKYGA